MIDTQILITKRTERGLSQRQLAKHAGVNRETIRRLEHGADSSRLPLGVLFLVADALGVQATALLSCEGNGTTPSPTGSDALNSKPLRHNAARLLRRIDRGEDVRRTMTTEERQMVLPSLCGDGLAQVFAHRIAVDNKVGRSLRITQQAPSDRCSEEAPQRCGRRP